MTETTFANTPAAAGYGKVVEVSRVSPIEIILLIVLLRVRDLPTVPATRGRGQSHFKLAIYAVVGLTIGGCSRPDTPAEWFYSS